MSGWNAEVVLERLELEAFAVPYAPGVPGTAAGNRQQPESEEPRLPGGGQADARFGVGKKLRELPVELKQLRRPAIHLVFTGVNKVLEGVTKLPVMVVEVFDDAGEFLAGESDRQAGKQVKPMRLLLLKHRQALLQIRRSETAGLSAVQKLGLEKLLVPVGAQFRQRSLDLHCAIDAQMIATKDDEAD